MPSAFTPRRASTSRSSSDDSDAIAADLERSLSLAEADDRMSLTTVPSVVSSLAQLSVLGSSSNTPRGESFYTLLAGRSTFLPHLGGVEGDEGETPRSTASVAICFISSTHRDTLCLGKVGKNDKFCLAPREENRNHCGITSHGRRKHIVAANTPAACHSNRPCAYITPTILREGSYASQGVEMSHRGGHRLGKFSYPYSRQPQRVYVLGNGGPRK